MDLSKKTLKSVDQAYKDAHLPACRLPHVLYIAQRPPFPAGQPDGLRAHSVTVGRNASISTRGLLTASTAVTVPQVAPRHVVATRFRHTEEDRPSIPKHSDAPLPDATRDNSHEAQTMAEMLLPRRPLLAASAM